MQICINFAPGRRTFSVGRTRRSGATAFRGRQFRTTAWRSSHAFPRFSVCSLCVWRFLSLTAFFFFPKPLSRPPWKRESPFLRSLVLTLLTSVVAAHLIRGSSIRTRGRALLSVFSLRLVKFTYISFSFFFSYFFSFSLDFSLTRAPKSTRAFKDAT